MPDVIQLDPCLSARDGLLHVEGIAATRLVEEFGSPLFVVSEDQLRRNVRRFRDAFARGWTAGPVQVMPAVKASWSQAVQRVLAEEGCGADVYSPGELEVALRAGVAPAAISVNGQPKSPEHIRRTVEAGARLTIDSPEEVRELAELAPALAGRTAKVRLRLRPALPGFIRRSDFVPEGPMPTDLAALAYKGGLCLEEAIEAGRRLLTMKHVELVGFHQHQGRHHPSTEYWRVQMESYARDLGVVCRALGGVRPTELDIGGGFAMPRDPHNAATDYSAPYLYAVLHGLSRALALLGARTRYAVIRRLVRLITSAPNATPAPSVEAYAEAATGALLAALPRHGLDPRGVTLQVEPGRALHGDTGVHLATVRGLKRQARPIGWNVVSVDTSEFFLTGGRFEHHLHAHVVATKVGAPPAFVADVTGRSCFGDRLLGAVRLPDVAVGDVIAFLDTGAYQEGSASNFNAMPRPATVLVKGDEAFVIRAAETLDDVLARDRVPAHLARAGAAEGATPDPRLAARG